jgi:hypothetical protein
LNLGLGVRADVGVDLEALVGSGESRRLERLVVDCHNRYNDPPIAK